MWGILKKEKIWKRGCLLFLKNMNISETEHKILKVLAYCYVPLSSRDVSKILENQMRPMDVVKEYNSLRDKGFLITKGTDTVIRPDIAIRVLVEALNDKSFIVLIPDISKYEEAHKWSYTSYRLLRNLMVKRFSDNVTTFDAITLADIRYRIADYLDYFEAIVDDKEFYWLFQAIGERALYGMLNLNLLDIRADLLPMDKISLFDQKLKEIPDVVVAGNASNQMIANNLMLDGQFEQMETYLSKLPEDYSSKMMPSGIHALYRGDAEKAYKMSHPSMTSKKKTEMFVNYEIFYAAYYILSLLGMDAEQYTSEAQKMLAKKGTGFNYPVIIASAMMYHALGDTKNADEAMSRAEYFSNSVSSLDLIFMYIAACFTETKLSSRHLQSGETLLKKATNNGYRLLALELAFALAKIYQTAEFEDRYMALSKELKLIPVLSRKQRLESWELSLNNLLGVMTMVTPGG